MISDCPYVHREATPEEANAIYRCWRDATDGYRQMYNDIEAQAEALASGGDPRPGDVGGVAAVAARTMAALGEMQGHIAGVHRRLNIRKAANGTLSRHRDDCTNQWCPGCGLESV